MVFCAKIEEISHEHPKDSGAVYIKSDSLLLLGLQRLLFQMFSQVVVWRTRYNIFAIDW